MARPGGPDSLRAWARHPRRRLLVAAASAIAPDVVTAVDGLTYVVNQSDDGPGGELLRGSRPPELDILPRALAVLAEQNALSSGPVFVDVGANIGTTVMPALAHHGFARAIAIEPEPENVRILRANVALNRLYDDIEVLGAAAGSEPGRASFRRGRKTTKGWRAGAGRLSASADTQPRNDIVEVDVVTVDDVLRVRQVAPSAVGMLWLDVQGHEGHVLAGAPELLSAAPPLVFAARARKLVHAGEYDSMLETIARTYTSVADMRVPTATSTPTVRPAKELDTILSEGETTDILAFNPR